MCVFLVYRPGIMYEILSIVLLMLRFNSGSLRTFGMALVSTINGPIEHIMLSSRTDRVPETLT